MKARIFRAIRRYNKIYSILCKKIFGIQLNYLHILERESEFMPDIFVKQMADYLKLNLYDADKLKDYVERIPDKYFIMHKQRKYY